MLAAHATELFLKGAILRKDPANPVMTEPGHNINALADKYDLLYPETGFMCALPFRLEGSLDGIHKSLKKEIGMPSMVFRYPVTKDGDPWETNNALEPHWFKRDLIELREEFKRLRNVFEGAEANA